MNQRRHDGAAVEQAAATLLQAAGLRLLERNVHCRGGELDLVMLDPRKTPATVVFVEVRYRRTPAFGGGAASVDAGKRRRLIFAARHYLLAHSQLEACPCRFDVVEATGEVSAPQLRWIEDAFRADD